MTPGAGAAFAIAVALAACLPDRPADAAPAEPAGFRGEPYLAPVPGTLAGARVVDDDGARALWLAGAAFVDVMPRAPRPEGLPEGTLWRDAPHETIPGAVWLPNTGYQALAAETLGYFLDGLADATGANRQADLVIFCRRDCWMSWNAAKRAVAEGYRAVVWYPDGVDGWRDAGWPLELATPAR